MMWTDVTGRPYAWSFLCGEHGEVYVAAEIPYSGEAMITIHRAGCGTVVATEPFTQRRFEGRP